ncbi:MAG: class III poly(R)-hydroxyalkanoic acid synthase subunit PhaC [Euryarchaeota archaeon]|nr:class III poly(R)-hydroxyalkanoic acid synthase subunit PhaC [Euryarchaeota archaeon]
MAQIEPNKEFFEANIKMLKCLQISMNPPEVDVGTTPADVVFEHNKMKLLRYRPLAERKYGPPLLIVYANINKPYILDLQPDRSVIRRFLENGVDVYMIEWGDTTEADMFLTIEDYIDSYIRRAVDYVRKESGAKKISLMGYCIGGFFSTIFASLYPDRIRNLIVMSAPINFDTDKGPLHVWTKHIDPQKIVRAFNNCPPEFLNTSFLLLGPLENTCLKYIKLCDNIENEEYVKNFFRMEKWLHDDVAVPGRFYEEYIKNGYQQNLLIKNELVIGKKKVNLKNIKMPLLVLVGTNDNLTPPDATTPLIKAVRSKDKKILENVSGHIGVSVGSYAHKHLWPRVVDWLQKRSDKVGD